MTESKGASDTKMLNKNSQLL